jgi:hypothetical protein
LHSVFLVELNTATVPFGISCDLHRGETLTNLGTGHAFQTKIFLRISMTFIHLKAVNEASMQHYLCVEGHYDDFMITSGTFEPFSFLFFFLTFRSDSISMDILNS